MKATRSSSLGTVFIPLLILGVASGCGKKSDMSSSSTSSETSASAHSAMSTMAMSAKAMIEPTEGNNVRGTVRFVKEGERVRVIADLTGLTPGEHGIHVHENEDCSAADGSSAGGHFNPTKQPHAGRDADARHIGDMGNIKADSNGMAHLDYVDSKITLSGQNSVVGRSVVVHSGPDDMKTQPSGDSGKRVACGPIKMEGSQH